MRILFDQGVPRGLIASLSGHGVIEARKLKWERISNGALLKLAEEAGFDLIVTTDKNVRYQQNLASQPKTFHRRSWKFALVAGAAAPCRDR